MCARRRRLFRWCDVRFVSFRLDSTANAIFRMSRCLARACASHFGAATFTATDRLLVRSECACVGILCRLPAALSIQSSACVYFFSSFVFSFIIDDMSCFVYILLVCVFSGAPQIGYLCQAVCACVLFNRSWENLTPKKFGILTFDRMIFHWSQVENKCVEVMARNRAPNQRL